MRRIYAFPQARLKRRDASSSRRREYPAGSLLSVSDQGARSGNAEMRRIYAFYYSVLSATTGSFFAAAFAGIKPLIKVNAMLITTMVTAEAAGNVAKDGMPVKPSKMILTTNAIK